MNEVEKKILLFYTFSPKFFFFFLVKLTSGVGTLKLFRDVYGGGMLEL